MSTIVAPGTLGELKLETLVIYDAKINTVPNTRKPGSFLGFLARTYYKDRCLRSAAALCYTTLLSLVPLTAVVFSIFAAFPVFETIAADIQAFVFNNFIPTSGEVIQQYIEQFASKASKLTAIGIAFLVLSALLMMNTIEGAINDIWYITTPRKPIPKFMMYWAVLTLGPILIGASLAITSYLTSLPLFSEAAFIADLKTKLLGLLPFLATMLACTLLYAAVPNTHVPLRNAIIGAVIAAALFELAKKGFALYITAFPTYEVVYGALATIPVFLVWVYLSWMVVLLGAEISYCLTHRASSIDEDQSPLGLKIMHDFRSIGLIWQAQRQGNTLSSESLIKTDDQLDEAELEQSLSRLEQAKLIHQTNNNEWALSKDMSTLSLADLYQTHGQNLPEIKPEWINDDDWYRALDNAIAHANNISSAALATLLQPLYQEMSKVHEIETPNIFSPLHKAIDDENQRIEPTFKL
jgi:membrane protein